MNSLQVYIHAAKRNLPILYQFHSVKNGPRFKQKLVF